LAAWCSSYKTNNISLLLSATKRAGKGEPPGWVRLGVGRGRAWRQDAEEAVSLLLSLCTLRLEPGPTISQVVIDAN